MGLFDKLKKKKDFENEQLPVQLPLPQTPQTTLSRDTPTAQYSATPQENISDDQTKLKIDLLVSEISALRTQMEMVNERLKIIEKKIDQKGTIRYV
jgi:hypothetical protein